MIGRIPENEEYGYEQESIKGHSGGPCNYREENKTIQGWCEITDYIRNTTSFSTIFRFSISRIVRISFGGQISNGRLGDSPPRTGG